MPKAPALVNKRTGNTNYKVMQHNRDVLYHGKPDYNAMGQLRRPPKQVVKAYTDYSVQRSGGLTVNQVRDLVLEHYESTGVLCTTVIAATGAKGCKGFIDSRLGFVSVDIIPMEGVDHPYVQSIERVERECLQP